MKKIKLASLALLLFFASCKKNNIEEEIINEGILAKTEHIKPSAWKTPENWRSSDDQEFASISDSQITDSIVNNGLLLLFAKTTKIIVLPTTIENDYVYYQVEKGTINITGGSSLKQNTEFSYFIFTKDQLTEFAQKGIHRSDLIKKSYHQIKDL